MGFRSVASVTLAHQGGWDELLLIAGPIVVVVGLLAVVKRRVERAAAAADKSDSEVAGRVDDNIDDNDG